MKTTVVILTIIVVLLGYNQYQQSSRMIHMADNVTTLAKNVSRVIVMVDSTVILNNQSANLSTQGVLNSIRGDSIAYAAIKDLWKAWKSEIDTRYEADNALGEAIGVLDSTNNLTLEAYRRLKP
jgi:hypothetical protein